MRLDWRDDRLRRFASGFTIHEHDARDSQQSRAARRAGCTASQSANRIVYAALVESWTMALVYSTEHGRICPGCQRALAGCRCKENPASPAGDGIVRVSREKSGRAGKTVTVVRGLQLDASALAVTGKQLRTACGAGGTTKDGVIEMQGDHVERVVAWLTQAGHRVRRAGG
jgi:translation initiation factor 1